MCIYLDWLLVYVCTNVYVDIKDVHLYVYTTIVYEICIFLHYLSMYMHK